MSKKIYRYFHYLFLKILRNSKNSPHQIAMGMALGIFIGLGPTFGFQLVPTIFLCHIFRLNKFAGTLGVLVSNPLTVVPIYLFNYWIGSLFFDGKMTSAEIIAAIDIEQVSFFSNEGVFFSIVAFFQGVYQLIINLIEVLGPSFLFGCFIVGLVNSILFYFITKHTAKFILNKRKQRKKKF